MMRLNQSDKIEWHWQSRLPPSAKLHYVAPEGRHPLTPTEIREQYVREDTDLSLVIWQSAGIGRFGFRAGIDELTWDLQQVDAIELSFCRPAKGAGDISLYVHERHAASSELALSSDRFEPALLDWFRSILAVLMEMFPDKVRERDDGYDA